LILEGGNWVENFRNKINRMSVYNSRPQNDLKPITPIFKHSKSLYVRKIFNRSLFAKLLALNNEKFIPYDDDESFKSSKRIIINNENDKDSINNRLDKRRGTVKNLINLALCGLPKTLDLTIKLKLLKKSLTKKEKTVLEKGVFFELEQNPNSREHMEDYINIENSLNTENNHQLYVLCDGHSGNKSAEIVVKELPEIFFKCLEKEKESSKESIVEKAIVSSFIEMDQQLQKKLTELEDLSGSTANLVYLCIENEERVVYSGNVGDSRNILIREKEAIRLSYDHKASDKQEIKRVKAEGGIIIRKRLYGTLAITRALGDFEMKEGAPCLSNIPHVTRTVINKTDQFLVMASDGIWDVYQDEAVFDLVKSLDFNTNDLVTDKPKDLAKILVQKSQELGSKDNISCIAIKLN